MSEPDAKFRCARSGCDRPSHNGQANEFCSRRCKVSQPSPEGMPTARSRGADLPGGHVRQAAARGFQAPQRPQVVDASSLQPWSLEAGSSGVPGGACVTLESGVSILPRDTIQRQSHSPAANDTVCLWEGDITALHIDGIVNAANRFLAPGGGISGAIHAAAGPELAADCGRLGQCSEGQTVLTPGYDLPARFVLHTVGPTDQDPAKLHSCYHSVLKTAVANGIRSLAFCTIATGIYGFPPKEAAHVALSEVRSWLDKNPDAFDRVVFVTWPQTPEDHAIYKLIMPAYFPGQGGATGQSRGVPSGPYVAHAWQGPQGVSSHQGSSKARSSRSSLNDTTMRPDMANSLPDRRTPAICLKPGCGRPTYNGQQNAFCSKACRGSLL